ncbi:52 kDa repressor of the inhibitor of the protein kinase-like [Antedon mediterranea]|uniref:52 kDa repressor of the inhibitor of the protein kinase-like n=1 Tax=Antedon mediterranea TaxID=105859 RepID=UPI003AF92F9A
MAVQAGMLPDHVNGDGVDEDGNLSDPETAVNDDINVDIQLPVDLEMPIEQEGVICKDVGDIVNKLIDISTLTPSEINLSVGRPFKILKHAKGKDGVLDCHTNFQYHKTAVEKYKQLSMSVLHPEHLVDVLLNDASKQIYKDNIHILQSIIEAVLLCGKQNITLRGHRDDSTSSCSNTEKFLAILKLLSSRDPILRKHLESTDEVTTTTTNKQVLSFCVRFLTGDEQVEIAEHFVNFVNLNRTTGKAIADAIMKSLSDNGFNYQNLRGQAYNGASAMSSAVRGVNGRIRELPHLKLYFGRMISPDIIGNDEWSWDPDTRTKAQGLYSTLQSFEFLMSFFVTKQCLFPIRQIAVKLQHSNLDSFEAYHKIDTVISQLQEIRRDIDNHFSAWFSDASQLTVSVGGVVSKPRTNRRQLHRSNVPANTIEEYIRKNLAIPFIDHLLNEMETRFNIASLFEIIPELIIKSINVAPVCEKLLFWRSDLPSPLSYNELRYWRAHWITAKREDHPQNLLECLRNCDKDIYPNIYELLCILYVVSTSW